MAEEELPQYDQKADIWSIGVIVLEVLTGCQPFRGECSQELTAMQEALLGPTAATTDGGVPELFSRFRLSPGAEDFLMMALQLDPAKRADAVQLSRHQWLNMAHHQLSSRSLIPRQQQDRPSGGGMARAPSRRNADG
jgi:serine/threonine protein kinase